MATYEFFGVQRGTGNLGNTLDVQTGTIADGGTLAATADIYVLVNTATGSRQMDVALALTTIEGFILSGPPVGSTQFPDP